MAIDKTRASTCTKQELRYHASHDNLRLKDIAKLSVLQTLKAQQHTQH